MVSLSLVVLAVLFALQAVRARALLSSAIWLAGVSALEAMLLYHLGAQLLAVVELSVGTGLVTVLLVLTINIAGDSPLNPRLVLPKGLAAGMCLLTVSVLGWMLLRAAPAELDVVHAAGSLQEVHWQARGLDVLVQVILIFAGVLGFLGLLADTRAPLDGSLAAAFSLHRERELQVLEDQSRLPGEDRS